MSQINQPNAPVQQTMTPNREQELLAHIAALEDQVAELHTAILSENYLLGAILQKYNVTRDETVTALQERRERDNNPPPTTQTTNDPAPETLIPETPDNSPAPSPELRQRAKNNKKRPRPVV
tara:strand:+ start:429 stop:794 length:366 start_codon:yes stop_codon:yes gene_type:complete